MKNKQERLLYIDNLKILLVILVVLSHIAITYGPIGFWYYYERTYLTSTYLLAFFVSLMQSFLIGLFFLISAYFTTASLGRKGPKRFINDRLKRLGLPLLFYIFVIAPTILYLNELIINGRDVNYFIFYYQQVLKKGIFDVGPLWFLQVLLFFSIIYVLYNYLLGRTLKRRRKLYLNFPSNKVIFLAIILLALITFIVRLWFPISATTRQLNIGLAPQYIFLFGIGIMAYKNKWFDLITLKKARIWFFVSITSIILMLVFITTSRYPGPVIEKFAGGSNWGSFIYSSWESTLSISLSITIIYFFSHRLNYQNIFIKRLSKSSYTVFIIHALIIVVISYLLRSLPLHPVAKFALVALIGIPLCFLISYYISRAPYLKEIL